MSHLGYESRTWICSYECKSMKPKLEMSTAVTEILKAGDQADVAVMLFDLDDNVVGYNHTYGNAYGLMEAGDIRHYEDVYWWCVRKEITDDPDLYVDPNQCLERARSFRSSHGLGQFIVKHRNSKVYLSSHRIIPGIGKIMRRVDIIDKLTMKPNLLSDELVAITQSGDSFVSSGRTGIATAIVDEASRVLYANSLMDEFFRSSDTIKIQNGRVVGASRADTVLLHQVVREKSKVNALPGSASLRIAGADSGSYFLVSVFPNFSAGIFDGTGLNGSATLHVIDPNVAGEIQPQILVKLFGLTLAEAKVATSLGMGRSVAETAKANNVSVGTVRNQLKSIFGKVGINRQTDLVRLMTNISQIASLSGKL
jgi:DNA-binding CsgD family transcriptional regulator